MFMVIVYSDTVDPGTYIIETATLDEAIDVYYAESDFINLNGGPEAEIQVVEVARFVDIV